MSALALPLTGSSAQGEPLPVPNLKGPIWQMGVAAASSSGLRAEAPGRHSRKGSSQWPQQGWTWSLLGSVEKGGLTLALRAGKARRHGTWEVEPAVPLAR